MRVQIWHSPQLNEWRWSLYTKTYSPKGDNHQQTGSRKEIREAMNDVAAQVADNKEGERVGHGDGAS